MLSGIYKFENKRVKSQDVLHFCNFYQKNTLKSYKNVIK